MEDKILRNSSFKEIQQIMKYSFDLFHFEFVKIFYFKLLQLNY